MHIKDEVKPKVERVEIKDARLPVQLQVREGVKKIQVFNGQADCKGNTPPLNGQLNVIF